MSSPLRTILAERSLVLTMGSGGVGKTTIAAALGLGASHGLGRSTSVLTVDPARRLASVYGLDAAPGPIEITLPPAGVDGGRLIVEMIDPAEAWDDLVSRELGAGEAALLRQNSMYRAVTRQFVQSHDFIAVERLFHLLQRAEGTVIVDTPPSVRGLDFLAGPARMRSFLTLRSLSWFTGTSGGPITDLAARPFRAVGDRVLGRGFVGDLVEFFRLAGGLVEGLLDRADRVQAALDGAAAVIVTSPESGPLIHARALGDSLDSEVGGPDWCASVVNLVTAQRPTFDVDPVAVIAEIEGLCGPEQGAEGPQGLEQAVEGFVRRGLERMERDDERVVGDRTRMSEAFAGDGMPAWAAVERRDRPPASIDVLAGIAAELDLGPAVG